MSSEAFRALGAIVEPIRAQSQAPESPDLRYALTRVDEALARQVVAEYQCGRRAFCLVGPSGWGRRAFLRALAAASGRAFHAHLVRNTDELLKLAVAQPGSVTAIRGIPAYDPDEQERLEDVITSRVTPSAADKVIAHWPEDQITVVIAEAIPRGGLALLARTPDRFDDNDLVAIVQRHLYFSGGGQGRLEVSAEQLVPDAQFFTALRAGNGGSELVLSDLIGFSRTRQLAGLEAALAGLGLRVQAPTAKLAEFWADPAKIAVNPSPAFADSSVLL